ncbi:MAG: pseudouridine synthase [Clostridia bacterium]|nr:pseudouridine synthase [Clostridia bacterium]
MSKSRLDKLISNQLLISRSVVRTGIYRGKATVNGEVLRDPSAQVDTDWAVSFDGQSVSFKEHIYILIYKPRGVICATEDKSQKTVLDLLPENIRRRDLAPVGRLDKDTTGLLLITDDGAFAHDCISPKKKISKTYIATLDGDVTDEMCEAFANGVTLADGTLCRPAVLERIGDNLARIVITEGKYHQIKRMFGTVGLGVNALHRAAIGNLQLPHNMCEGDWIEMTKCALESQMK